MIVCVFGCCFYVYSGVDKMVFDVKGYSEEV